MPGPLPDPNAIRRNAPTIPTTRLPAGGRRGRVPSVPRWRHLGPAGKAWWRWAWRTPEACAWDDGAIMKVADRAALEDDLASIMRLDEVDDFLSSVAAVADIREVKSVVASLAALATNKLAIVRQMNEIDDRLGLSPKGRDALRLKVVPDADYYPDDVHDQGATSKPVAGSVSRLADRRRRSVDAS